MSESAPECNGFLARPYKARSGWTVISLFERSSDAEPWLKLLKQNGIPVRAITRVSLQVDPRYVDEARRLMKAECERLAMEPWPPKPAKFEGEGSEDMEREVETNAQEGENQCSSGS